MNSLIGLLKTFRYKLFSVYALPLLRYLGYKTQKSRNGSHYFTAQTSFDHLVNLHLNFLSESGWLNSKNMNAVIDNQGDKVPWLSYPSINFLSRLNLKEQELLEFGSGSSTSYFSNTCKNIISYEFDLVYFRKMQLMLHSRRNLIYNYFPLNFSLAEFSKSNYDKNLLEIDKKYLNFESGTYEPNFFATLLSNIKNSNIILIDGGPRNWLTSLISKNCRNDAILILDNSDQPYLYHAIELLKQNEYYEIPFLGLGPLNTYHWNTSFFSKNFKFMKIYT